MGTAYVTEGNPIRMPFPTADLHYEVELGVIIGKSGKNIPIENALDHIEGYAIALDMTARCLQTEAKNKGRPWAESKGFDCSCPISMFVPKNKIEDPKNVEIKLDINGETRQHGNTKNMIFPIDSLIAECSTKWTLERGDFLITGTPEGVGSVRVGDILQISIPNIVSAEFTIGDADCC